MAENPEKIISPQLRGCDLFCGTGAFSYAMKANGIDVVFASDMKVESQKMYEANFPGERFHCGDINTLSPEDIPAHDVLTAGFPCVSFSSLGKRLGFEDPRARTIEKVGAIAKHHKPRLIVIENVKNLLTYDGGKAYATVCDMFQALGYTVKSTVLDTAKVSHLPHHRERLYITCLLDPEAAARLDTDYARVDTHPFRNFLQTTTVPDKYFYSDRYPCWPKLVASVKRSDRLYQLRSFKGGYVREVPILPCMTGGMGSGGHQVCFVLDGVLGDRIRKLTPRECYNLQGFPSTHVIDAQGLSDPRLYVLCGNSVSLPVVQQVLGKALHALKD